MLLQVVIECLFYLRRYITCQVHDRKSCNLQKVTKDCCFLFDEVDLDARAM